MSQSPKRTGQSGAAQVRCIAREGSSLIGGCRTVWHVRHRPRAPSPPNTIGMMSASQARRRTTSGGERVTVVSLAHAGVVEAVLQRLRGR